MGDWESYDAWSARLDAWLASLPPDSPILKMCEADQLVAFDELNEAMAGIDDFNRNGGVSLDVLKAMVETKH